MGVSDLTAAVLFFELIDARFPVFETAFVLAACFVLALAPPGFVLHWVVLRRLRTGHQSTWELLGRPTAIYYRSLTSSRAVMRFFRRAEFEALGDPSLSSVCRAYRTYAQIYSGLIAATLITFCLALLTRG